MSVSPIGLNATIQRVNDIGSIKQNEDNKPFLEQQSIQTNQAKQEHELTHKVAKSEEKDNENYRYDAKEKGKGSYQKQKQKEKKKQKEPETKDGKVIVKGRVSRFDMKI